ncbi:MAG: NADH-quinone oxidoreductase subunit J [Bdellovibrionota bacterium]
MLTEISFLIMGVFAVFLSLLLITRKWPVTAAMLLVVVMMLIAGMYGLLGAHFSAVAQIIVYAGAIMVVFIFVIMLLNIPAKELNYGRLTIMEIVLSVAGVVVALVLGTKVGQGHLLSSLNILSQSHARAPYYPAEMNENVKNVAALMFTDYLWAFELISFLILSSIIGAVVIAKKEKVSDVKPT